MSYRILIVTLQLSPLLTSATELAPKRSLCSKMRSCCKTQAQIDAEEREADLARQECERKALEDKLKEAKRKTLLSAKSTDLRAAYRATLGGKRRFEQGHTSDPEYIKEFRAVREAELEKERVKLAGSSPTKIMAAALQVLPLSAGTLMLPTLLPSLSSDAQLTGRDSTQQELTKRGSTGVESTTVMATPPQPSPVQDKRIDRYAAPGMVFEDV